MTARNPDEIMAEHLLRGGKMLAKACRECGSPLFEVKGETLCVVCRERKEKPGEKKKKGRRMPAAPGRREIATAADRPAGKSAAAPSAPAGGGGPEEELTRTIGHLCTRLRAEEDPDAALVLSDAVKRVVEALSLLRQP